ncbi:hypothetical protein N8I77_008711 [Diaporthe amygdali]|uniref:NAD-dependent epimerase/dehydratase domain-containing protein n=1 Tax=Phomopsis amygdali TaxID=1214568 RepID=A0AAD9S9V3_PHOAM|nr:hypothetical protein N8I77_008711 [Diaporthe amygdali]
MTNMAHNVLITGGSGYLGGSLLASWAESNLSGYQTLYALVRSDAQADAVKILYGAEPVRCDLEENSIRTSILEKRISVVIYLIDSYYPNGQLAFLKALGELKRTTGQEVHFVFTSGTKQFSDMAGAPTDGLLYDNDPKLYEIHKSQKAAHEELQHSVQTTITVIEAGEEHNVRVYVFSPCIVYGKGLGFGNLISIQTVDIVIAAKAAGGVYRTGREGKTWPVCHISDCTALFIALIKAILNDSNPDHGKHGFYLASSGSARWGDIYSATNKALVKREIIEDASVKIVTDEALQKMAKALNVETSSVVVKIGGQSNYTAAHGKDLGWWPRYPPTHILEALDDEVGLILESLSPKHQGIR